MIIKKKYFRKVSNSDDRTRFFQIRKIYHLKKITSFTGPPKGVKKKRVVVIFFGNSEKLPLPFLNPFGVLLLLFNPFQVWGDP